MDFPPSQPGDNFNTEDEKRINKKKRRNEKTSKLRQVTA